MDVRVRPQRRLRAEELMLLNCGAGEDSSESLLWTVRRLNQSILNGRADAEAETPILWPPSSLEKTLMLGKT